MRGLISLLTVLLLVGAPAPAPAQLFFAERPDPKFTIGPLILRANVTSRLDSVSVHVLWSVVVRPASRPEEVVQDLFLLWPGEVRGEERVQQPDPALARYVEGRGFSVIGEGRLALYAQSLFDIEGKLRQEQLSGGAPFVTFVQAGGAFGLSPPATYIRIPWNPRLIHRAWLMDLRMATSGLVKPKQATWLENLFRGERHVFLMSYNEVRERPLFPLYSDLRDRAVRLAEAPSELIVHFSESSRLKIDDVHPATSIRRVSESLESTEVISVFLEKSEGITPQQLTVQFGYFSRTQAIALVVIPLLFLVLGHSIGPVIARVVTWLGGVMAARLRLGSKRAVGPQESGTVLFRETLARIVPGQTTYGEVLELCGGDVEQHEDWSPSGRRTLIYRGRRMQPQGRPLLGWLFTVHAWDVEQHEVRIELERDVVRDVQAHVQRSRVSAGARP